MDRATKRGPRAPSSGDGPGRGTRLDRPRYLAVVLLALFVAILHMVPFWVMQSRTPEGFTFTGNLNNSPDYMQYRVWSRRSQTTGILVDNTFTTEPNPPHLPVVFYYLLGQSSEILQIPPEHLYWYAGSGLAFGLVLLLYHFVRQFFGDDRRTWPVVVVVLFGGGLGAFLSMLSGLAPIKQSFALRRTLVEGLWAWPTFEEYRGNYLVLSLFDSHYLLIWLCAIAAVLALYRTMLRFSYPRLTAMVLLLALLAFLHVYEAFTVIAISLGVAALLAWRKMLSRSHLIAVAAAAGTLVACLVSLLVLYRSSGLPVPDWRGVNILVSTVLLAYPLAWLLLSMAPASFWRERDFDRTFLVGWAGACTAIIFSGPFYPYPDRGTMTYQLPLYILAGLVYFGRFSRLTLPAVLVAVLLTVWTPAQFFKNLYDRTRVPPLDIPTVYLSPSHSAFVEALKREATEESVLLVDKSREDWQADDLWLFPEFPGRLYCGHFFLTAGYERKRAEAVAFFSELTATEREAFLRDKGVDFVFVEAASDPARFGSVPGLELVTANDLGALFRYDGGVSGDE